MSLDIPNPEDGVEMPAECGRGECQAYVCWDEGEGAWSAT
ncbi:hypothetical protein ACSSVY_003362 [Roseovarius sp. MBR-51]